MGEELRLLTELNTRVGKLEGKIDLVLERFDGSEARLARHDVWIANHEALHAASQGESNVRCRAWDRAWQIASPVIGALAGWFFATWRR